MFHVPLKECVLCCFQVEMLCKKSIKSISSNAFFKVCVSLLLFCLDGLFIGVNMALNLPTIIVLLSNSTFMFTNICPTYLDALVLGAYLFTVVISSSHIDPFVII